MAKKKAYDNDSISSLKGADRVRKRPGVIFGSDGLEGCEHAVFEILSNAIDEARAGFGRVITVTRFQDRSIQVEDQGRGCPVDWNEKEGRYNWELVFCEMYAGGKYDPTGENYEFSLGLNGLGSCATQYASRYMDVTVCRDGNEYKLHFQRGEIVGQMEVTPLTRKKTGTTIRWLPDLEVFTDIDIPLAYYQDVMKRQAVVNAGVTFRLRDEVSPGRFETQDFLYENGIRDYLAELAGDDPITRPVCWEAERQGRDRADKPEYKVKLNIAWCFSNRVHLMEHYHNSSFLEHGGSPDKATRLAFVAALDKYLRENNKYTKGESKITFPDVQECLLLVSSNFSTQTSSSRTPCPSSCASSCRYTSSRTTTTPSAWPPRCLSTSVAGRRRSAPAWAPRRSCRRRSTSPTGCRSSWTAAPRRWTGGKSISWRATRLWAPASSPGTRSSRG